MGQFISETDLAPFATIEAAKAAAMVADAEATAKVAAPCITDPAFPYGDAVKAVLRAAILRWNEQGTGAVVTQTAGVFSQTVDNSQPRRGLFWPSEIDHLMKLCALFSNTGKAYAVDTVPTGGSVHDDACNLVFGATYCSCGADLTGGSPLYGSGGW